MKDKDLADAINKYMEEHQYPTRIELRRKHNTSDQRLQRLHEQGLLNKPLPLALSASAAATLNRKRNGIGKGWYIKRPAPWQAGGKS
jgi:hypothetical protein